ncbi:hypothetical protein Y1Q_0018420 [Alligator mississippiensis]|uniref:SHSP domain-containing protein n=1 Tax=Alligator mississippiensis TaxID=8496 RepID=A0A151PC82_ALLMI|nr:hypothetical protein Y1Q_0018420 [Alligator mississippiensis]
MYELSTMFFQFQQHSQNDNVSTYKVNYTSVLFAELEREVRWEMERAQEFMSGFQQLLAGGGSSSPIREREQSTSVAPPQGVDGAFTMCQDVRGFDSKDLMVKLVGRNVLLTGKKETQSEDGKGSFSYKYEAFKQEWDVPEGVDPDGLTCSISS